MSTKPIRVLKDRWNCNTFRYLIAFAVVFLVVTASVCLKSEDDSTNETLKPMTSDEVNTFLQTDENVNISLMAENNKQFGMEMYGKEKEDDDIGKITFIFQKNDNNESILLGFKYVLDARIMDYEVRTIGTVINYRTEETYYFSRDAVPDYEVPLKILIHMIPTLDDIGFYTEELEWNVVLDVERGYTAHIATTSNETDDITVIIQDTPRRILKTHFHTKKGIDESRMTLFYDDEINITVSTDETIYMRTSIDMNLDDSTDTKNGIVTFSGNLNVNHIQEVKNEEIELRVLTDSDNPNGSLEDEFVIIAMLLTNGTQNFTDDEGYYWDVTWTDADSDGLVSAGDYYEVITNKSNADADYQIVFYDCWSETYEGGPEIH